MVTKSFPLLKQLETERLRQAAHLLSFRPAADLQPLALTDGHLESEGDPDVSQILGPRVDGEPLHAADVFPAATPHNGSSEGAGGKPLQAFQLP